MGVCSGRIAPGSLACKLRQSGFFVTGIGPLRDFTDFVELPNAGLAGFLPLPRSFQSGQSASYVLQRRGARTAFLEIFWSPLAFTAAFHCAPQLFSSSSGAPAGGVFTVLSMQGMALRYS